MYQLLEQWLGLASYPGNRLSHTASSTTKLVHAPPFSMRSCSSRREMLEYSVIGQFSVVFWINNTCNLFAGRKGNSTWLHLVLFYSLPTCITRAIYPNTTGNCPITYTTVISLSNQLIIRFCISIESASALLHRQICISNIVTMRDRGEGIVLER